MKTAYFFYTEKFGENEGVFDETGKLIDCWSCNDANWRDEYFNGFMEKLGIKMQRLPKKFEAKAIKQIKDRLGFEDEE